MQASGYSFEDALVESEALIERLESGAVSGTDAIDAVGAIVAGVAGARAFLVALLTGQSPLCEKPPEPVVEAFKGHADVICDVLTRNLVMSATMALTHQRNGDEENRQGSLRVNARTASLIKRMDVPEMRANLDAMWSALSERRGKYVEFLERWGYDAEQLEKAREALAAVRSH